ncbi:hypothetical protein [Pseudomonas viridiflava]|nr:hypothetical protein [Pseudomonas viridiflava]
MLQLMVVAGWSRRDIVRLCNELSSLPLEVVEDAVEESFQVQKVISGSLDARYSNYHHASDYISPSLESYDMGSHYSSQSMNSELNFKVRQLLVDELGLSSEEIVHLMAEHLKRFYVPPLSKKSLSNWLDRLSVHVPPSEVLYAATSVFNKFKDKKGLDWNVRR